METRSRMAGLFYVALAFVGMVVFSKTVALLFGVFNINDLQIVDRLLAVSGLFGAGIALGLTFYAYRHPKFGPLVNEVTDETSKVTWPTWDETTSNTVVTVIVTVIIAAILWGFDQVFGRVTSHLLGGGA
jgi:preprotein translocase SecE subunit